MFAQLARSLGIRSERLRIPVAPPLWMDVPSAEAPAFAGMTEVVQWSRRGRDHCDSKEEGVLAASHVVTPFSLRSAQGFPPWDEITAKPSPLMIKGELKGV